MKKSTKVVLGISAGLILLGGVLAAAGYAMAGGNIGVYYSNGQLYHNGRAGAVVSRTVETGRFTSLDITADLAGVKMIASDHYGVEYRLATAGREPVCRVTGDGALYFDQSGDWDGGGGSINLFGWRGRGWKDAGEQYLHIYYPADVEFDQVKIEVGAGDLKLKDLAVKGKVELEVNLGELTVENVTTGLLDAETNAGGARLSGVRARTLSVESDLGSIELDNVTAEQTTVSASSGSTAISGGSLGKTELDSNFGEIKVKGAKTGELSVDCDSGSIDLEGEFAGNIEVSSDFGSVSLRSSLPASDYNLDLQTDFGSVRLDGAKQENPCVKDSGGRYRLSVENSSGDIDVKFG
ncbi:DUF4097 family beta strand repeat protein [Clostridiaceae bacterium NSJ-31]|uniref:DUF4097 family beta strand repeat protein n=1 Tax=Ligaoa zhengdingensis TaxID=2763658 RepID=A0A926DX58_9FIRM|nr:DUF4097 family beta strand repeat-containing protein [Ligaoa zhengdingensis]MBC8546421.1 DUF4097 family beta strand repeat protein [Ligaoa zhengdingensis]